jgi:hypothetical protein
MKKLLSIFLVTAVIISATTNAQDKKNRYGKLTGGFESNAQYYNKKDETLGFVAPDDRFRSNNYLKVDYSNQGFTAGFQYENYSPNALLGYSENLKGNGFTNYYIGYQRKKYSITLGHFYEQFGNGLLLRSWEDRQIGINNAIFGSRLTLSPSDNVEIKLVYGKKRNAFTTGDGKLWGANFCLKLDKLFKLIENQHINTEISYVGKQESYKGLIKDFPETIHFLSLSTGYSCTNFSLSAEYTFKTKEGNINDQGNIINSDRFFTGDVLQINGTYTKNNSGFTANFRKVKNFSSRTDRTAGINQLLLNYIPALTKQHHYSLANIYVYNPQVKFSFLPGNVLNSVGEVGGQLEWYQNFPKNTKWGGKYGAKLEINFSNYFGLKYDGTDINTTNISNLGFGNINYQDFNIELKKNISKQLKLNFTFVSILYNQKVIEGYGSEKLNANIFITEGIYKFKNSQSIKLDMQHMWVEDGKGNWAAVTTEYNIAPKLTFFLADLYNYGNDYKQIHYYNVGGAFTIGSFRFMTSYGRQREGLLCVGGICRLVPASTGFNFSTNYSF